MPTGHEQPGLRRQQTHGCSGCIGSTVPAWRLGSLATNLGSWSSDAPAPVWATKAPAPASSAAQAAPINSALTAVSTAKPVVPPSLRHFGIKNTEFAGLFSAMEEVFYGDEVIENSVNPSAQKLPEIQSVAGRTDTIGLSGGTSLMLPRDLGLPVEAFGAVLQKGAGYFVGPKRSGIYGIADFKDKNRSPTENTRAHWVMLTTNNPCVEDVTLVPARY